MQRWLEDFAYRFDLGMGVFLLAGATTLAIALLTVGTQAFRAARLDPAHTLRDE
jgi:putative ABC transport system permease protein